MPLCQAHAARRPHRLAAELVETSPLSVSEVTTLTGLSPSSTLHATARDSLSSSDRLRMLAHRVQVRAPRCNASRLRGDVGSYARLLDRCGVVGPAAEVGVLHGAFSKRMLTSYRGLTHYTLVDLWAQQAKAVYGQDSANVNSTMQEQRYQQVLRELVQPNQHCVSVLRMLSTKAAGHFANNSLAFVYLDANHYYEHVMQDLEAFWPKVMPGGMLAGHDLGDVFEFGVQRAVTKFAHARRLRFTVTAPPRGRYKEPICCSGWYIWKPRHRPQPSSHGSRWETQAVAGRVVDEDTVLDTHYCFAWWLRARGPCSALLDDGPTPT